jgi:3,4-dihydroxy-9,10-secoandrosta-1,3,5(10)-triene-9,17-dione 4,5-dioxygenase
VTSDILACAYLGASAPDLASWRRFAVDCLGMQEAGGSTESRLLLRIDERTWRFWIDEGPGGVSFIGWEVANEASLHRLVTTLGHAGVEATWEPETAALRGVEGLISCVDPGGVRLEFFHSSRIPFAPFVSANGTRFVTSARMPGDMGFGHVVFAYADIAVARDFYLGTLGFRPSDICILGEPWTFTHVNARHHSLAIGPNSKPITEMHHFMVDQVGQALDRLHEHGFRVVTTVGRHTNDRMVSFYVASPSGFEVEYGFDGLQIDDATWLPATYEAPSYWGHQPMPTLPTV